MVSKWTSCEIVVWRPRFSPQKRVRNIAVMSMIIAAPSNIFLFIFIALDVILLGLGSYLYRYGSEQVECKQGSGDCLCRIEKDPVAKKFGKTLWVIGTGMLVTVVVVPGVLFGITKVFN